MVHTELVGQDDRNPEVPVRFYRTEAGGSPVLDWLRGLDKDEPPRYWARPYAGAVRLADWEAHWWEASKMVFGKCARREVRSTLPSQRIARLILCFHDQMLVVLHGFIKKTQKTPADDLALAKRRMKEVTK